MRMSLLLYVYFTTVCLASKRCAGVFVNESVCVSVFSSSRYKVEVSFPHCFYHARFKVLCLRVCKRSWVSMCKREGV